MAVLSRREFGTLGAARTSSTRRTRDSSAKEYWLRVHRRAMACRFEITLGGEDAGDLPAARRALDRIDAIEDQLTVFRDTSTVSHVNRRAAAAPVAIDRGLFDLLSLCRTLHHDTGGAFDITSTPLSRCWGYLHPNAQSPRAGGPGLRRQGRLPTDAELDAARQVVGMSHVSIDEAAGSVRFDRDGVEINLGAVGKGWALDQIAYTLRVDGVRKALLSAGQSSIRALGDGDTGDTFYVSLKSPRLERPIAHVMLRDGALGTSGAGVQFFEVDGKRYGHVIDPRTGWPAAGALSVSVLTTSAATADALSTAFFVGGEDLARAYCATHPNVLVVFTPDDDERRTTLIGDFGGADVEVE
jgi:thiamine biosynthesis lipoprotein